MATILVVDDDETICRLAARILSSVGHQVLTAANGLEAIALYRSYSTQIDMVVTDLTMPVMDGYQEVLLIRETRPDAKIICMSGYSDTSCPEGALFLQKPFLPEALRQSVDKVLMER
ncbi:MAG: response regulator [Bryobacteraceae bacterium]